MINQELIDEIIYISLKNELISKELIKRVVLSVISDCDDLTQKEFNGIYFKETSWDFTIAEVDEKGRILANYSKIIEQSDIIGFESCLERNLKIIGCLLHEIEHLKEESKKSKKDYLAKVLKYGCSDYVYEKLYNQLLNKVSDSNKADKIADRRYTKFCEKYWEFMPSERIAETSSRKTLIESLINYPGYKNVFFTEYKNLINYYVDSLKMGYTLRDYSYESSPIFQYFLAIRKEKKLDRLLRETPSITPEEKMIYGFPIGPKDIIEINKMKVKTRR